MINLANLNYLLFFIPTLLIIIIFLVRRLFWQKKKILLLASHEHIKELVKNFSLSKNLIKTVLLISGVLFLTIALLRPQWDAQQELINQEGRDLIIALDISRSMLATDVKPNRLEFAKNKIRSLVNALTAERVGLIVFSGAPFVQCPLTSDVASFFTFLDATDVETISSGTTAIDQAVNKAMDIFSKMPTRKNKILAIFTDGEDFSTNLQAIKQKAKEIGLHIFTIGIGTAEGAPIPLYDENGKQLGHQKDEAGKIVISRLNEDILKSLAADTAALYLHASNDSRDIDQLIKRIRMYEKEKFDEKNFSIADEKYYYFGLISLLCLLLEWIV